MADSDLHLYRYRYSFKNIVLTMDKDYQIRDEMAVSFAMQWNYAKTVMPKIKFTLQLERDLVVTLYEYRKTAKIAFDIYESQYDEEDNKMSTTLWLSHSYSIIPTRDMTHYITAQDVETIEYQDPMAQPQGVEMYLIDRDIYKRFVQQLSINNPDISKASMLQSLFEKRNIPGKTVRATPPDDGTRLVRGVLELGTLVHNIDEMNTRYGIYTADALIFHDYQYLYCINRIKPNLKIKSSTQFENVTFILANTNDPLIKLSGGNTDYKRKKHFINLQGPPKIKNDDNFIHSMEFANLENIDWEGTVNEESIKSDDTKMDYIYKHNELTNDQEKNTRLLTDQWVDLLLADSPISFFAPYKIFDFIMDTQYTNLDLSGHQYRLRYLEFGINKEGHEYESTIQLLLYRVDKTEHVTGE